MALEIVQEGDEPRGGPPGPRLQGVPIGTPIMRAASEELSISIAGLPGGLHGLCQRQGPRKACREIYCNLG